jgi:hypothetical protein
VGVPAPAHRGPLPAGARACLDPDADTDTEGEGGGGPWHAEEAGAAGEAADLEGYARAEELRLALGLSPGQLYYQRSHAQALAGAYRAARVALAAGRISTAQVRELLAQTRVVPAEVLPEVLARVLSHAPDQTTAEFRTTVRRAVAALVPAQAAAEFAEARAQRCVELRDEETEVTDATGARVVRVSQVTASTDPLERVKWSV